MGLLTLLFQVLQIEYTMGHQPDDAYHTNVIRAQLKSELNTLFPTMYDELSTAFNDEIPLTSGEGVCSYLPTVIVHSITLGQFI